MSTAAPQETVERTRQRIVQLVAEISQLCRQEIAPPEFFRNVVQRVIEALAAQGGTAWTLDARGRLELQYQQQMPGELLDARGPQALAYQQLLNRVLDDPAGQVIPPRSAAGDGAAGAVNSTDSLLVVTRLTCNQRPAGVLCVFQRPDVAAAAQKGFLQFLRQIAEIVEYYLLLQRMREENASRTLWPLLAAFAQAVHVGLEPRAVYDAIANEGRRVLECDRLSVAAWRGGRFEVVAVSGQQALDRRSNLLHRLQDLVNVTLRTGQPFRYAGPGAELAPEVQTAVEGYVQESSARCLEMLPLLRPAADAEQGPPTTAPPADHPAEAELVGALVIEQFRGESISDEFGPRVDFVSRHAALALANVEEYRGIPLWPLWRWLGAMRRRAGGRNSRRRVIALAVVLIVALLWLVPARLTVPLDGVLQPDARQVVAAQTEGVLARWHTEEGADVDLGAPLAELENADLESQISAAELHLTALRAWSAVAEPHAAARAALEPQRALLEQELARLHRRREQLTITSPRAGRVQLIRPAAERLGRNVARGDPLLVVYDPQGAWHANGAVSDSVATTLENLRRASTAPLAATVTLSVTGQVVDDATVEPARTAFPVGETRVGIVIRLPPADSSDWRPGGPVTVTIDGGRRPLGVVLWQRLRRFASARLNPEP